MANKLPEQISITNRLQPYVDSGQYNKDQLEVIENAIRNNVNVEAVIGNNRSWILMDLALEYFKENPTETTVSDEHLQLLHSQFKLLINGACGVRPLDPYPTNYSIKKSLLDLYPTNHPLKKS